MNRRWAANHSNRPCQWWRPSGAEDLRKLKVLCLLVHWHIHWMVEDKSIWVISITMTQWQKSCLLGPSWECCILSPVYSLVWRVSKSLSLTFLYYFFNYFVFIWSHFTLLKWFGDIFLILMLPISLLFVNSRAQYIHHKPNKVQNHSILVFALKLESKTLANICTI